ncbi:MAG: tetratricopeptide repeat protein, partial [Marinicella sp.]
LELYGPEHAYIGSVKNNLSLVEEHLLNWSEAEQLMTDALDLAIKTYGQPHAQSIKIIRNQAFYFTRRMQFDQAIKLWNQVIDLNNQNGNEFSAINATGYLALVYKDMQAYEKAQELHIESLNLYEASELSKTPDNLKPRLLMRYASTLTQVEEYDLSIELLTVADDLFLAARAPDYFVRLNAMCDLAENHRLRQEYQKAEDFYETSLELSTDDFLHRDVKINAYSGLAKLKENIGKHTEAKEHLEKAQKLSLDTYGMNHKKTAEIIYLKGINAQMLGQIELSKDMFTQALDIQELVLPAYHPDLSKTRNHLSSLN